MNRIRHICRSLARLTGSPGTAEPRPSQPTGPAAHRASRPGLAALPGDSSRTWPPPRAWQPTSSPAGQLAPHRLTPSATPAEPTWPPTATTISPRRTVINPSLLPHTVQLCIHCQHRPAGFWVSRTSGQTVRRPWCLSCSHGLDRNHCDVTPFES